MKTAAPSATTGKAKRKQKRSPPGLVKSIHITRLDNLKTLIAERFKGNSSELARAIKRSHTFMWQLLNEYRAIGEDSARMIEQKLGLAPNSLDATGIMDRTERLIAHTGDGHALEFRMTPLKNLNDMGQKPKIWLPFPKHAASEKAFCLVIDTSSIIGLNKDDIAFADPKEAKLEDQKLYVTNVKSLNKSVLLIANRDIGDRWVFVTTQPNAAGKLATFSDSEVKVIARVVSIVRNL